MLHIHSPCFVSLWFKEQDTDILYSTKNNFVSLCTITRKIQATCPVSILGNLTLVSGDIAPRHLTTYSVPSINAEKSNRPLSRRLLIKLIATNYYKN